MQRSAPQQRAVPEADHVRHRASAPPSSRLEWTMAEHAILAPVGPPCSLCFLLLAVCLRALQLDAQFESSWANCQQLEDIVDRIRTHMTEYMSAMRGANNNDTVDSDSE